MEVSDLVNVWPDGGVAPKSVTHVVVRDRWNVR